MDNSINDLLARMHHTKLGTVELGLERVEKFLSLLGNPHKRLPPVIHVAGTNGKGSLLAYLNAILEAAGYKVHRYTSPHLVSFNERIQIAGKPITDDYLKDILGRVVKYIDTQPVTFFESTTAAAFLAFSEQPADVVLLETGLGGRLDATNVIENPILTAITPISLDHMEFLGNSITKIATEKAGIMKQGVPCVIGKQPKDALEVFKKKAKGLNAPLYSYWREWKMVEGRYRSAVRTMLLQPSLAGKHQLDNAATAVACIEKLPQFNVSDEDIQKGISNTVWPARLQRLDSGKLASLLPKGAELWLDGGHNPEGGEMLAAWLAERNFSDVTLICGMMQGKDSAAFLKPLVPLVKHVYTVAIEGESLSQTAQQLQQTAKKTTMKADTALSVENALQTVAQHGKTHSIVCICGSLYLAGKVLALNGE